MQYLDVVDIFLYDDWLFTELIFYSALTNEACSYVFRNHHFITMRRLVVFNYDYGLTVNLSPNSIDIDSPILRPLSDDCDSLILCAPEGEDKDKIQSSQNKSKVASNPQVNINLSSVELKLKNMLSNISIKIYESLQREMLNCEEARSLGTFPSWLLQESRRSRSKVSDDTETLSLGIMSLTKKIQSGRLRKFMGDLSLQVPSTYFKLHLKEFFLFWSIL